eukprot:c27_g1_i1.p1 GENE.c27_g1_i1~~c27_g1_i1.p1  ORF type:complete len:331 (-),score=60.58 c27_g1_i1:194-1186(-)
MGGKNESSTSLAPMKGGQLLALYLKDCQQSGLTPVPLLVEQMQTAAANDLPYTFYKLSDVPLIRSDVSCIANSLRHNPFATRVDLVNCQLDDSSLLILLEGMSEFGSVTHLNVSNNHLSGTQSAIAKCLHQMPQLLQVNLSQNNLGNTLGGDVMWGGVKLDSQYCQINKLNLSQTNLPIAALLALAAGLRNNKTIRFLSLQSDNINSVAAQALALAISHNTTITTLDLKGNDISTAGAQALGKALSGNKCLKTLVLWSNNIPSHGCALFFQHLVSNRHITHLDIGCNQLSGEASSALKQYLSHTPSLATLGIASARLYPEDAVAIAEGFQ